MIVCVCRRVSERQIEASAHGGCSFEQMQEELGVARACGCCRQFARKVFDASAASPGASSAAANGPCWQTIAVHAALVAKSAAG